MIITDWLEIKRLYVFVWMNDWTKTAESTVTKLVRGIVCHES